MSLSCHRDGWKQTFVYTHTGKTYELRSLGADGKPSADDLVVMWPPDRLER